MSSRKFSVYCSDLVIPSGSQQSNSTIYNSTTGTGEIDDAEALLLEAPNTLTGTLSVLSGPNKDGSMNVLQSPPGTDILLTAGHSIVLTEVPFAQIAVLSGAAEGGVRTIKLRKQVA
jgi:hypothetical protein